MMKPFSRVLALVAAGVLTALAGCGETGSNPVLYPEVQIQIGADQGGTAQFVVDTLVGGGVLYTSLSDETFTALGGTVNFFLEGAAPPYSIQVRQVGDATVRVHLLITGSTDLVRTTSGADTTVTVQTASTTPLPSPVPPTVEVRADVCAPSTGFGSCSPSGSDPGVFGRPFTGTFGDPFTTHLLSANTPAVYFLSGARDNVSGVFQSTQKLDLFAQLFTNGALKDSQAGTGNVVVRADL